MFYFCDEIQRLVTWHSYHVLNVENKSATKPQDPFLSIAEAAALISVLTL